MTPCVIPLLSTLTLLALAPPALADDEVRATFTKYEHAIPMRDGVKLYTAVYVPKDPTGAKRFPILLTRTPYDIRPYGVDAYPPQVGPSPELAKGGYIFALQDVRGRFMSGGEFVNVRPMRARGARGGTDESTDAFDTIDYLVKRVPSNNGRVGMIGISYPGFYAACALVGSHPALKAVSPQAPISDWFIGDDFHHNGALLLAPTVNFLMFFGAARPQPTKKRRFLFDHLELPTDGYDLYLRLGPLSAIDAKLYRGQIAFWRDLTRHGTYDAYWRERELTQHLRQVKPAVMTVGGWFDAEDLYGTLQVHRAVERARPAAPSTLVMGPWSHGGWSRSEGSRLGNVSFGVKTAPFYRDKIERVFFDHHLKGSKTTPLPKAYVFETGTNNWRQHRAWPPPQAAERTLCLQRGGRLTFTAPTEADGFDQYVSDPAKPVPYVNYPTMQMPVEYMTDDQRFAARRPDVLAYETEVLSEDTTVAGPIAPRLFVSTTGTDSDWVVKLIDVYPDDSPRAMGGYQQLVRGEVMRGKFRASYSKPEPFTPGRVTRVELVMPDVYHTFRRGHRIMVQVQSSWFPLIDRNPQRFVDIYSARASDFQSAVQRVYRSAKHPSCVRLRVMK
jgi:uncharacterized protein